MIFTVIGHYTNNGLKYLGHHETATVEAALLRLHELYPDESITVSAVIEGRVVDAMEGEYVEDTSDFEETYGE
jgi:hypothetical protein